MAGTVSVGSIIYEIDMDTSRLLTGRREVDAALNGMSGSMGRLEASASRTERSVASMERTMSSLSGVAKGLLAALSVQQVGAYADAWTVLNNKISNSVKQGEQQADVMQRVFSISQATQSSLNGTATLYSRLERGTRLLNTSSQDLAKLTTIINQGFAVSGATAQEAENAIVQLSQGLASGALRGEEFNSVSEQGSRLMIALADSLGVSLGELRAMAAQGKITNEVIVNGLLSQGDAIGKEFARTTVSISQGLLVAGNNVTKFFGENATVKSFSAGFRDSVITISESLDGLSSLLVASAIVMGSRYVGALTLAAAANIKGVVATRQTIVAEAESARQAALLAAAKVRTTEAAKLQELEEVRVAQVMRNSAITADALSAAETRLSAARRSAATATAAYNSALIANSAAQTAASTAARNASVGFGLARGALSLIGGPAGAAMLAGTAIYYFYQSAQRAKQEAFEFANSLDGVISKLTKMSDVQISAEIAKSTQAIMTQSDAIEDQQEVVDALTKKIEGHRLSIKIYGESTLQIRNMEAAQRDLAIETEKLVEMQNRQSRTMSAIGLMQAQLNGQRKDGIDLLKRENQETSISAGMMNQLGNAINFASRAKDKFNSSSLELPRSDKADAYNADLEKQNTLLSITDKRLRAVTKARMDAQEKGGNVNQVNTAGDLAGQQYDLEEAENERNKTTKNGTKTTNEAANAIANLERQIGTVNLRYDENTREAAQFNAVQALGSKATEAQKQRVSELAGALYDAQQKQKDMNAAVESDPLRKENKAYSDSANQLKRQLAGNIIDQQQYNQQSEQLEVQHQAALAQIRANQSVTPQQQAAATVDPVQQLANENAQKLALIQQFTQQRILTEQQGLALMNAANTQYEQQRVAAQWAIFTQQSVGYEALGAAVDSFGQGAGSALSSVITRTQSASDAARSLANTVLTSAIQAFVDMGNQQAKSAIMGATVQQSAIAATTAASVAGTATTTTASTAAAATTATAWTPAAIVASIGSFGGAAAIGIGAVIAAMALSSSIAGKRKNGGSVSAGSMYQVGESGLPEIYKASNGRQYMIPGDSGKVISNKDIQGGGGSGVIVNVNNYTSSQVSVDSSQDGSQIIDILITDAESGGAYSSTLQSTFGLTRQANGDY